MYGRPVVVMAPTRQLMTRLKTDVLELCLIPLAPTPTCPVDYQLWVAHQEDPEKDVHREVYACGTTCTVEAGGPAPYWSILTAFDYLAKFVKYGYMTVGVHIGVPVTKADVLPEQVCDTLSSALCCNMALLFDDPASSDVTITAGDTVIHAHKTILAAQSPTFRAMFQSGMRETTDRQIELGDMDGPVLTALVSAMYWKLKEIPAAIALPLFLAADKYQINALRQACHRQLTSHITVDTILPCYSAADSLSDNKLRSACINFMACPTNSVLVAKHPDMRNMMRENPDMIQKMWVECATLQAAPPA